MCFLGTTRSDAFARPTGGDWQIINDGSTYTNGIQVNVYNSNAIEMYADMMVDP